VAELVSSAFEHCSADTGLAVAAIPIPVRAPERLLGVAASSDPLVVWSPSKGSAWFGLGAAAEITGADAERFRTVRDEARDLFSRLSTHSDVSARRPPPEPRLFGGAAFVPGSDRDARWRELGDARFVLPRFTVVQDGGEGWLLVAANGSAPAERIDLAETAQLLASAVRGPSLRELGRPRLLDRRDSDPELWHLEVQTITSAIDSGEVDKVVAARWSELELDRKIALDQLLARLSHECPSCTRFVMRRRRTAFVGATPEWLVTRHGRAVSSLALAGSMPRTAGPTPWSPEAQLLGSGKNRDEHRLVVEAIRETLAPLCRRLEVPPAPTIRELRHVLHLATPLAGELADDTHVLELVEALHPTPAVGGVPRREALRLIADQEPSDRGWYAGPVGWFDARGDGEFAVAIRSALIDGARARIFAGAGIVHGSEPASEYRETLLKQGAMVHGLGLEWETDEWSGPS
jgi:menaquinone-specific isochorismate synthase